MRNALVAALITATTGSLVAQGGQYKTVEFYDLADFNYNAYEPFETTPHKVDPSPVPAELRHLDGQRVAISGLAMLLTVDKDGSSEFILTISADACAYGMPPRLNEWIDVKMIGERKAKLTHGKEYEVKGVFHLKETIEDGRVTMLYSMDADSVQ